MLGLRACLRASIPVFPSRRHVSMLTHSHIEALAACRRSIARLGQKYLIQYSPKSGMLQIVDELLLSLSINSTLSKRTRILYLADSASRLDNLQAKIMQEQPTWLICRLDKKGQLQWPPPHIDLRHRRFITVELGTFATETGLSLSKIKHGNALAVFLVEADRAEDSFWSEFNGLYPSEGEKLAFPIWGFTSLSTPVLVNHHRLRQQFGRHTRPWFIRDALAELTEDCKCDLRFTTVSVPISISSATRRVNPSNYFSEVMSKDEVTKPIVDAWKALPPNERECTIVYCVDRAHCLALRDAFAKEGIQDTGLCNSLTQWVRFCQGQESWKILLAPRKYRNLDDIVPRVDCLILAHPTVNDSAAYRQQVKFGGAVYPGKRQCHVIEPIDSVDAFVARQNHILQVANLDSSDMVTKATVDDLRDKLYSQNPVPPTGAAALVQKLASSKKEDTAISTEERPLTEKDKELTRQMTQRQRTGEILSRMNESALHFIKAGDMHFVQDLGPHSGYMVLTRLEPLDVPVEEATLRGVWYKPALEAAYINIKDAEQELLFESSSVDEAVKHIVDLMDKTFEFHKMSWDSKARHNPFFSTNKWDRRGPLTGQRRCIMDMMSKLPQCPESLTFKSTGAQIEAGAPEIVPLSRVLDFMTRREASNLIARLRFAPEVEPFTAQENHRVKLRLQKSKTVWGLIEDQRRMTREKRANRKAKKSQRRKDKAHMKRLALLPIEADVIQLDKWKSPLNKNGNTDVYS